MVYCKIANKLVNNGAGLEQRGRCAVATNSGQIKGMIQASGAGSYNGTLDSFNTRGPAKISGKAASNTINFNAEFVDRKTNKPTKATIKLVVANGKYRLVSNGAEQLVRSERHHLHAAIAGGRGAAAPCLQITPSFFCRLDEEVVYWNTTFLSGDDRCAPPPAPSAPPRGNRKG